MEKKTQEEGSGRPKKEQFPGYPEYPEGEDIYSREKEEQYIDESGSAAEESRKLRESQDEGLDVPGGELDDEEESIGEEDEENNYYSLGGDDHDDLEEDKGE